MSNAVKKLQVLLVEDEPDDLRLFERDFPNVFSECQIDVNIHPCGDFDEALALTANPLYRYDLIISDTYKGPFADRDAQVLKMIKIYRDNRFCPLVVYSSGTKPADLKETVFVVWADKGKSRDIERAIKQILGTNIPQLARKLQDELDRSAGSYLWGFLEDNWKYLQNHSSIDGLERLIRRRASIQLSKLESDCTEIKHITAADYYIMPPISKHYRLGQVLQHEKNKIIYVLLTPHCHLMVQEGQTKPRADHLLIVPTLTFDEIIKHAYTKQTEGGQSQFQYPWGSKQEKIPEKLSKHIKSPPDLGSPNGRYWFLPGFMTIPDSYCDFMKTQSVPLAEVITDYNSLAVLDTPFAEALQSCFTLFYSSVGIPNLNPSHFMHLTQSGTNTK